MNWIELKKVKKNLTSLPKKFCEFPPWYILIEKTVKCEYSTFEYLQPNSIL